MLAFGSKASCPALGGGLLPSSPYGSFLAVSVQAFAGRESSNRHSRFKKKKKGKIPEI